MSDMKPPKSQLESFLSDAAILVEKAKNIELNKANVNTAIDLAKEYGNNAYDNFNFYNKESEVIAPISQLPLKPHKESKWFSKLMNVVIAVLCVLLVVAIGNLIYTVYSNPEPFSLEHAAGTLLLHLIL